MRPSGPRDGVHLLESTFGEQAASSKYPELKGRIQLPEVEQFRRAPHHVYEVFRRAANLRNHGNPGPSV